MDVTYGIAVSNKYNFLLEDDDDPNEIRQKRAEAKSKKKDEVEKKPKPKPEKKADGKIAPVDVKGKPAETPSTKKEEKSTFNRPERGGRGGRSNREPHEIHDNDVDKRPPRRQPARETRDHRGDENVPPEFRDRPEGSGGFNRDSDRSRGRGGARGFGRGGRPGRGGRGGTREGFREGGGGGGFGGFGGGPNVERRFDRHSGSDKTGIKPVDKREGGGARNWGTFKDDLVEPARGGEQEPRETWAASEEVPDSPEQNGAPEGEQTEEEEPAKLMTLDEWKALQKQSKTKVDFNIRKAGEGEDKTKWNKGVAYTKKKDEQSDEDDDEEEDEDRNKKKDLLDIRITFNESPRRGRGGRRPRDGRSRGGRGAGGLGRGGDRKPREAAPRVDDEIDFPSLVKSAA